MKEVLLDTDIISYYFRQHPQVLKKFEEYILEYLQVNISRISVYEIVGGLKAKQANKQLSDFLKFISENHILEVTVTSMEIASEIYASLKLAGKPISDTDIFIAGIAIEHNLVLVTNNTKHFENIEGLEIDNWTLED
ncbi:MAG: type II toxin-antitoxin system VapC family toxin [Microscillaceae bacterium]|nr:type II toxin-antitoxin system VapC family toxin [Microscillaceae bacterium]